MRERIVALAAHLLVVAMTVTGCVTAIEAESPVVSFTPTESLAPTPSPTRAASPTSTSMGQQAFVTVFKVWDADGNLATTDDREAFEVLDFQPGKYPLDFELDLDGASGEADVSTLPLDGVEQAAFMIEYEDDGLTATVTEVRKDDSALVGAHCLNAATNEIVSGSRGDAVSFDISGSSEFVCTFFNTPIPDLNVEGN